MTFKQYLIMQLEEDCGLDEDLKQDIMDCDTHNEVIVEIMSLCGIDVVEANSQFEEYLDGYVEMCGEAEMKEEYDIVFSTEVW